MLELNEKIKFTVKKNIEKINMEDFKEEERKALKL
jgi:hypothetical protein